MPQDDPSTPAAGGPPAVTVAYHPGQRRFVATVEGSAETAFLDVIPAATIWTLSHTEVPRVLEGQGVGSTLVREALAYVRAQGAQVMPLCPFVAAYLRRYPAEQDIVHPNFRYMVRR